MAVLRFNNAAGRSRTNDMHQIRSASIIIVSYNHRHVIADCLTPLMDTSSDIEIVVVDNASTDGTADLVRRKFPRATLLENPVNGGFGYGCNRGATVASNDVLIFLNPDAVAGPVAIMTLVAFINTHVFCGAVGPKVLRGNQVEYSCRPFPGYQQFFFHRYSLLTKIFPDNPISRRYLISDWDHDSDRRVDWISGSAMAVRRPAFEQIGGFDENYFLFCEDTDLCRRLRDAGWEVWFTSSCHVHHAIGESIAAGSLRSLFQRHRSIWLYYRKFHRGGIIKDTLTIGGIGWRFLAHYLLFVFRALHRSIVRRTGRDR